MAQNKNIQQIKQSIHKITLPQISVLTTKTIQTLQSVQTTINMITSSLISTMAYSSQETQKTQETTQIIQSQTQPPTVLKKRKFDEFSDQNDNSLSLDSKKLSIEIESLSVFVKDFFNLIDCKMTKMEKCHIKKFNFVHNMIVKIYDLIDEIKDINVSEIVKRQKNLEDNMLKLSNSIQNIDKHYEQIDKQNAILSILINDMYKKHQTKCEKMKFLEIFNAKIEDYKLDISDINTF